MARHDLTIRFWGVRGSHPVPGTKTSIYGGNTACIEIKSKQHTLILDAGTGIIPLGENLLSEYRKNGAEDKLNVTVLLSHTHHDHIQGLPYFKPAYKRFCSINIFGPELLGASLEHSLSQNMDPQYYPVRFEALNARKNVHDFNEKERLLFHRDDEMPQILNGKDNGKLILDDDLVVHACKSPTHPIDGVLMFKIVSNGKTIVYATDTEGVAGGDENVIGFAAGADVLIHDAQYVKEEYADSADPKRGFGHSTVEMACEVAEKAQVGKLILFHHDPSHDDARMAEIEKHAQSRFTNSNAGKEGMELHV